MSWEFRIMFMGAILGYLLAELVSVKWCVFIIVLMLIVAVFYKPKAKDP